MDYSLVLKDNQGRWQVGAATEQDLINHIIEALRGGLSNPGGPDVLEVTITKRK